MATLYWYAVPKAMSISRSEMLRKAEEEETEVEKLPSVKVLESVKTNSQIRDTLHRGGGGKGGTMFGENS